MDIHYGFTASLRGTEQSWGWTSSLISPPVSEGQNRVGTGHSIWYHRQCQRDRTELGLDIQSGFSASVRGTEQSWDWTFSVVSPPISEGQNKVGTGHSVWFHRQSKRDRIRPGGLPHCPKLEGLSVTNHPNSSSRSEGHQQHSALNVP